MSFELGKMDSVLEFLLKIGGKQPLNTVAEAVNLSPEVIVQWINEIRNDQSHNIGKMLFFDPLGSLIWIPGEHVRRVQDFLEKGGFGTYYDQKHKAFREEQDLKELQHPQMEMSIKYSRVSLKRSRVAQVIALSSLIIAIATFIINALLK